MTPPASPRESRAGGPGVAPRRAAGAMALRVLAQGGLGIATGLSAAQVHVALTHQVGAVILWVLILRARHLSLYPIAGSIRKGTA